MFSENSIVSCHWGWTQLYYVIKTKTKQKEKKHEHKRGREKERDDDEEEEEEERRRENGREKVVKQYNIRQPLEHNNTERDKY